MKAPLYNLEGEKIGEIELPEEVFNVPMNRDLLHQAVRYYESIARKPIAKTKDRAEVSGGGRKPWPQKGTGRARHGSIRSPIWRGGGVTFGPTPEKKYAISLPKKMKRKAFYITLSQKLRDGEIVFVDKLEVKEGKTKLVKKIIDNLSKIKKDLSAKKILFVLAEKKELFKRAARNLPLVSTIIVDSLNPYLMLKRKYVIIEKDAIEKLKRGKK